MRPAFLDSFYLRGGGKIAPETNEFTDLVRAVNRQPGSPRGMTRRAPLQLNRHQVAAPNERESARTMR